MMRVSAVIAAACLLAQPAFACREGGAAFLFDDAPDSRPVDLTTVHGQFQSSGPIEIAVNHLGASRTIGPYTQVGAARLDSGETVQVFAVLHSCLTGIASFAETKGDYFMVGKLIGDTGARELLVADRFTNSSGSNGVWTSRPY